MIAWTPKYVQDKYRPLGDGRDNKLRIPLPHLIYPNASALPCKMKMPAHAKAKTKLRTGEKVGEDQSIDVIVCLDRGRVKLACRYTLPIDCPSVLLEELLTSVFEPEVGP